MRFKMMDCPQCSGGGRVIDPVAFGKRVSDLREKMDITQRQLAFAMNISPSFLCMLEKGERNWSKTEAEKCLDLLKQGPKRFRGSCEMRLTPLSNLHENT